MKILELLFSGMSVCVAIAAGVLLALDMAAWALVTSWAGTGMVALGYAVAARTREQRRQAVPLRLE